MNHGFLEKLVNHYIVGWFSKNGDHPAIFMPGYKK